MPKDVIMPALGMAQETGILLQWFKSEGDEVTKGEPLMEIETDKATVEIEASAAGILANITAHPGDEIPVGQVIALILAPGETVAERVVSSVATPPPPTAAASAETATDLAGRDGLPVSPVAARIAAEHNIDLGQVNPVGSRIQKDDILAHLQQKEAVSLTNGRTLASPKARRLAREQNLDLTTINGSGPEGAILAANVLDTIDKAKMRAAEPSPTPALTPEALPMGRMWQVMAQRLTESWQTVPHFYLEAEANASQLKLWRASAQKRLAEKLTFTDLLVKVVALALCKHLRLNARWVDGTIFANEDINIGLAVAVEEGLLVPVIHQADKMGLNDLAARRKEVVDRAQANKLSLDDMSHGTFTISNLGMFGVDSFNAIVNPPQAAILALGRIGDKVVPIDGQPTVQPMMKMTLSCDHRVIDGARGARFLQTLVQFIEDPLAVLE